MKATWKTALCLALAVPVLGVTAYSGGKRETSWTFDKKERVKVSTVSGDCVVKKGETDQIEVVVISSYYPRDSFEPKARESGRVLKLSEKMYESNSGSSTWTLTVPDGTDIYFSTASGDLAIDGLTGEFSAETASGDIEITDCQGQFDINTASGDIEVAGCTGEFELSTASGAVDASDVEITEASSFTTASGEAQVRLARTAEHDLHVGSASGYALLDYGGNPMRGSFEMVAKLRKGRIRAPFRFDDEEEFRRWGDRYVRKVFTRGKDAPEITIRTATGKAVLREG